MKKEYRKLRYKKKHLTARLDKEIRRVYKEIADEFGKKIEQLSKNPNKSAQVKILLLQQHKKDLLRSISAAQKKIERLIEKGALVMTKDTYQALVKTFHKLGGLDLTGAYYSIPEKTVRKVLSGQLYKNNWSLSKAIWKHEKKMQHDIDRVIAKGIASNKSTYEIAKDLEKYIRPSKRKPWDWSKVYPNTSKKIEYNSQRAARTIIQHAYQQAYKESIAKNPFIDGSIWNSAMDSERTCQLCMDRDGQVFPKGLEPLDHPQGLCWLEPVMSKSMNGIADELADWAHGKDNPDIDEWLNSMF